MSVNQPTILVKKADGSSVRLTMEEFRKYREERKTGKEVKSEEVIVKSDVERGTTEALATSTPVTEVFVNEAAARVESGRGTRENTKQILNRNLTNISAPLSSGVKQWSEEDNKPLLEEEMTRPKVEEEKVLPDKRENIYQAIIKYLKFPVADDILLRLQSLVTSRIKDIRTDEQVLEYALREVAKGGLGFSQTQAEELLQAILSFGEIKNFQIKKAEKQIEKLESRVDNFKIEEFGNQPKSSAQIKNYSARPVLHDVVPAPLAIAPEEKRTVGPLEEFSEFRLIDFRRLSADPEKAGKILQDKFAVLKKESFLFYLQAVQAWYRSPLYREYLAIVAQSVENRKKVREIFVSQGRESLQEAEFNALVKLHEHLST